MQQQTSDDVGWTGQSRRTFLAATGAAVGSTVAIAGCIGDDPELTIYSDRREEQIDGLFEQIEEDHGIEVTPEYGDGMLSQLIVEEDSTPADIYYTQSSGELAALKAEGLTEELPDDILDMVEENYRDSDGQWVGASGRVRAIQFNSNEFSADELPDDIFEYAEDERFKGRISTRPNSGTFRSFIVAMMEMEGEDRTREWVQKMVEEQEIETYGSGSQQAEAVHNGEQDIALGNQYYAGRILNNHPDSPLNVAFTRDDPGCLFNVSGLAITAGVSDQDLAEDFIRHTLEEAGQEFFVEVNGEYPVVDGVEYVGDLPTLDDINPPEFDLNNLENVDDAQDLLNEEGLTV